MQKTQEDVSIAGQGLTHKKIGSTSLFIKLLNMQTGKSDDKLIPFTSLGVYRANYKQRQKNINITAYKYLFTYFQGADRPPASKRS